MDFKANIIGNIPANRLLTLEKPNGLDDDKVYLQVSNGPNEPDFVSTKILEDGAEESITIKNEPVWTVEASEYIPAGISVTSVADGKVAPAKSYDEDRLEYTIGVSLNSAQPGEVVRVLRKYKVRGIWVKTVNEAAGLGGYN